MMILFKLTHFFRSRKSNKGARTNRSASNAKNIVIVSNVAVSRVGNRCDMVALAKPIISTRDVTTIAGPTVRKQ